MAPSVVSAAVRRARAGTALATAIAVASALAACGSDTPAAAPPDDSVDQQRMWEVAEDRDATIDDIVDAGYPVDADHAGDGSAMVIYQVLGEHGEGASKTAWRLYDPAGDEVSEGRGGRAAENALTGGVLGLDDGFLLAAGRRNLVVSADGSTEKVPRARRRLPVEEGDVRYRGVGGSMFRPGDPMIFIPVPRDPVPSPQGWAIDAEGQRWVQAHPNGVYRTSETGRWQRTVEIDLETREYLLAGGITVVDDRLVVPIAKPVRGGPDVRITALAARRTDALPTGPWRYVDSGPFAEGEWDAAPVVFAADQNTLVISDWQRGTHRLDLSTGEWSEVQPPTDEEFWEVEPGRGGLFAFHDRHGDARFSDDWGESWESLPH